jgi:uncharacterized membrane protein
MAPALLMGLGLGGFVDGIVLHQILQWHHMLTDTGDHPADTVAGLETNTVADGFFHMGTWVFVLIGTLLTVRAGPPRVRLTSLTSGGAGREGCSDAQEVPAGVQA